MSYRETPMRRAIPVAPLLVLLLVVVLCEHALRRPRLPRAIAETLIHQRAAEIADAATITHGDRRATQ